VPVLRRFLTHEDPGHRAFAGRSLGGLGATEALADLRAALAAETAPFARQQLEGAARALRPLSEWLVDLADPRPPVRRAAAAALAERGDVAALPQVTAACASEYDPPTLEVLRATLERLSRLRGPR
jgi:HEAT repeat protein